MRSKTFVVTVAGEAGEGYLYTRKQTVYAPEWPIVTYGNLVFPTKMFAAGYWLAVEEVTDAV